MALQQEIVGEGLHTALAPTTSLGAQSAGLLTTLSDVVGIYWFSIAAIK